MRHLKKKKRKKRKRRRKEKTPGCEPLPCSAEKRWCL
jgi:hypothetical protein